MDTVDNLLVEWGFEHLVDIFKAEQIDLESFLLLDSNALKDYLPAHGPRLKFLNKLNAFKEQAAGVEVLLVESDQFQEETHPCNPCFSEQPTSSATVTEVLASSDSSRSSQSSPSVDVVPSALTSECALYDSVLSDTLVQSALAKLDVVEVLKKDTVCAKAIEKLNKGQRPAGEWRNRIVDILVTTCLLKISVNLTLEQLKKVSQDLIKCLPGEKLETYYLEAAAPLRRFVGGKLVDKYRNRKRGLNDDSSEAGPSKRKKVQDETPPLPTTKYTAEEVKDAEAWLKYNREPWGQVLTFWAKTYDKRMSDLYPRPSSKKDSKIFTYIETHKKVLRASAGYQLLVADFDRRYPDRSACLFSKWPAFDEAILKVAQQEAKDAFSRGIIRQLMDDDEKQKSNTSTLTESARTLLHLMLLPALFKSNTTVTIDPKLVQAGGKKVWKPSLAETRNGFILYVKHANDIKTELERRQTFMKSVGCSCQPVIVACGPSLSSVTHYILSVDDIMYPVPGPLQAVDYLFKSFQSLHCWYPIESEQVWLFLQREIYGITTQFDNVKSNSLTLTQTLRKSLK